MKRLVTMTATLFVLGACSAYEKGEVIQSSPEAIKIGIGYGRRRQGRR